MVHPARIPTQERGMKFIVSFNRRRTYLLLIVCTIACMVHGATWYVSTDGTDGPAGRMSSGRTPKKPLRTLFAALEQCSEGDSILLRRGDTFYDQATNRAPQYRIEKAVVLGAYGHHTKPRPRISGGVRVNNWKKNQKGAFTALVSDTIGMLYINGSLATIARYPNSGWIPTTKVSKDSAWLRCDTLQNHPRNKAGYWNGATIRHRVWSWYYMIYEVKSYDESGILYVNKKPHRDHPGWKLYLEQGVQELDTANEWCFVPAEKKVYLIPPESVVIDKARIEGSVYTGKKEQAGMIVSSAGVSIEDITFCHYRNTAVLLEAPARIQRCRFENCGGDQGTGTVRGWKKPVRGTSITHCHFVNILDRAIVWHEDTVLDSSQAYTIVKADTFSHIMDVAGYGDQRAKNWSNSAVVVHQASGMVVRENVFTHIGYAGVIFGSGRNTIEYNYFRNCMSTLNDGGAIYWNCGDMTVRYNIVVDTRGYLEPVGPSRLLNISHGIWPEYLGGYKNNFIAYNTVIGSGADGLFLPYNFDAIVKGNVLFGNARDQMRLTGRFKREHDQMMNHRIENNILFSNDSTAGALFYTLNKDFTHDFGYLNGNYYCTPRSRTPITEWYSWGTEEIPLTIEQWQMRWSWADSSASISPIERSFGLAEDDSTGLGRIVYNASMDTTTVQVGRKRFVDVKGKWVPETIQLTPFESRVLIYSGE